MQRTMRIAGGRRAAIACGVSLVLVLCATPALAQDYDGPSGTTADIALNGTVKDRPTGTISVTAPTNVPFNVIITPDGTFSSLETSSLAVIENRSQDAAVSAAVTKVTDAKQLLDKVKISLNSQQLNAGQNLNLELGQAAAATTAGGNGKLELALSGTAAEGNPVIAPGSYDVVSTITLSRVANS